MHYSLLFVPYSSNCDVQCGHLVASIEMSVLQNGHFFVVGAAGAASSSFFLASFSAKSFIPFMSLMMQNKTNAKMRKLMIVEMN